MTILERAAQIAGITAAADVETCGAVAQARGEVALAGRTSQNPFDEHVPGVVGDQPLDDDGVE